MKTEPTATAMTIIGRKTLKDDSVFLKKLGFFRNLNMRF